MEFDTKHDYTVTDVCLIRNTKNRGIKKGSENVTQNVSMQHSVSEHYNSKATFYLIIILIMLHSFFVFCEVSVTTYRYSGERKHFHLRIMTLRVASKYSYVLQYT